MKRAAWLWLLSMLSLACRQNEEVTADPSLPFDRELARLAIKNEFNGSVLVALPDTVFEQSYRAADAPETMYTASNLRYPIAEVGQLLLRAAYFRLADQKRIQLNAAVVEHLPTLPMNQVINYRMLLDHRAGLPDVLPDSVDDISQLRLLSDPGVKERYSTLGYHLLADALGRILNTSPEEAIRTLVIEPAGMKQTGVFNPQAPVGNLALGHSNATGALAMVPLDEFSVAFRAKDSFGNLRGLPEYYSTITDLFYLAQWMPESGYLRGKLEQPGVRPGYRSYFYSSLEPEFTTIVLSNYEAVDLPAVAGQLRGGAEAQSVKRK